MTLLPSENGSEWIPVSLPPPRFETVDVQLADGTIATGLYTGAVWCVCGYEGNPRFWRTPGATETSRLPEGSEPG